MPLIPQAVLRSDDYMSLTDDMKRNFIGRMNYCAEAASKALSFTNAQPSGLMDAVDDIELDVYSMLSAGNPDKKISAYLVHSSWTFDCDRLTLGKSIAPEVSDLLGDPMWLVQAADHELTRWVVRWGTVIDLCLSRFGRAQSFTEAVGHLITLDAVLASFLVFAASVRLNPRMLG